MNLIAGPFTLPTYCPGEACPGCPPAIYGLQRHVSSADGAETIVPLHTYGHCKRKLPAPIPMNLDDLDREALPDGAMLMAIPPESPWVIPIPAVEVTDKDKVIWRNPLYFPRHMLPSRQRKDPNWTPW